MYGSLSLVISETHASLKFLLCDLSNQSYKGLRAMLRFTSHYILLHVYLTICYAMIAQVKLIPDYFVSYPAFMI